MNRYSIQIDKPTDTLDQESCLSKVLELIKLGMVPVVKRVTEHRDYIEFDCESLATKEEAEKSLHLLLFLMD